MLTMSPNGDFISLASLIYAERACIRDGRVGPGILVRGCSHLPKVKCAGTQPKD